MEDKLNPTYYTKGIETTDYIISHNLGYIEGNIIKYITRWKDKNGIEDLKKCKWYIDKLIKENENEN